MKHKHGFSLIDTLVALLLLLVAMTGSIQVMLTTTQACGTAKQREGAWQVLGYARTLTLEQLRRWPERSFDLEGTPTTEAGFYQLQVDCDQEEHLVRCHAQVRWQNGDKPEELHFERLDWGTHEEP